MIPFLFNELPSFKIKDPIENLKVIESPTEFLEEIKV
jgi:hypothetical protein